MGSGPSVVVSSPSRLPRGFALLAAAAGALFDVAPWQTVARAQQYAIATAIACPVPGLVASTRSAATAYWDANTLTCRSCEPGMVLATALQLAETGTPCVCQEGTYLPAGATGCQPCPPGQAPSLDRTTCLGCPGNGVTVLDASIQACGCASRARLIDRNETTLSHLSTYACVTCARGEYPSSDYRECISCPDPLKMIATVDSSGAYTCQCDTTQGYSANQLGGRCVLRSILDEITATYPKDKAAQLEYDDVVGPTGAAETARVASELFNDLFYRAAGECTAALNDEITSESCQLLGNLCVLQLYADASSPCDLYMRLVRQHRETAGAAFPDWPLRLPWLYYNLLLPSQNAFSITTRELSTLVSFGTAPLPGTVSSLKFVLACYSLNGSFTGFRDLAAELELCPTMDESLTYLEIGHNFESTCQLDLRKLVADNPDIMFYDLYVNDGSTGLFPVPIRITNLPANADTAGLPVAAGNRLVRRFFLTDLVTSREAAAGGRPSYVRFAQNVTLVIPKSSGTPGKLDLPYVDVTYTTRQTAAVQNANAAAFATPDVTFRATYYMPTDGFWRTVSILFPLLCMLAVVAWLYKCFSWTRRNVTQNESLDFQFLALAAVFLCSTAGPAFAWFLFGISSYWMIFFKWQSVVYVFLPTAEEDLRMFFVLLLAAFIFELVYVLWVVYRQCTIDVFFMDWERSRGKLLNTGNEEHPRPAPVSVWRSVFMANEWNRLQTYRRVSVEFSLIWMVFFMRGLNLRYLASQQPDGHDLAPGIVNPVLLFCVNSTMWTALAIVQAVFHFTVYDRYYRNRLLQFVDLLSMANVSFLSFDERAHGFYVHGRSVHVHADTDMAEMTANLKKEEQDMVSIRGLGSANSQTFEIYITRNLRDTYDKVYSLLAAEEARQRGEKLGRIEHFLSQPAPGGQTPNSHNTTAQESVRAYEAINGFLCNFIDNNLKEHRYVIRETTYAEKISGLTPDLGQGSVFYSDPGLLFSRLIFHGIETRLLTLYGLLFTVVDVAYDRPGATGADANAGTVAAALVVYAADLVLRRARSHFGEKNLAAKTLIDWRFLL